MGEVLMSFASYFREVNAARTSAAMRRHMSLGRRMGGRLPYGYAPHPENPKRMVEVPEELAAIQTVIQLTREGESMRSIARMMEAAQAARGHTGIPWTWSRVRCILDRAKRDGANLERIEKVS